MSSFFFRVFQHLLPRARAWQMVLAGFLRSFFEGLSTLPQDTRDFIDGIYFQLFPDTTTNKLSWDEQFGLPTASSLTDQQRIDRLDAAWKRTGGQGPAYLQQVMQDNGFNVFIHTFWDPALLPARVVRNPNTFLSSGNTVYFNECSALTGQPQMNTFDNFQCGDFSTPLGYVLVNKIVTTVTTFLGMGDPQLECGEDLATCGNSLPIVFSEVLYTIPSDPDRFPFFLYWGAATFPELADVSNPRREEFEDLLLAICPGQQWLGILVNYI